VVVETVAVVLAINASKPEARTFGDAAIELRSQAASMNR